MSEPLVSVIVTTYNRERCLKETIQSILDQTFNDFELIVVDNFSNYDFFKTIESFGDVRIHAYQNQNNGIISVNRNFGLSKALGKYVAFCDDDDLWMPEKLNEQIKLANGESKLLVATPTVLIDNNNVVIGKKRCRVYRKPYHLFYNNRITLSSVLVEKTDLVVFDESPLYRALEDYALWISLVIHGYRIKVTDKYLTKYRLTGNNVSNNNRFLPVKRVVLLSSIVLNINDKKVLLYYVKSVIKDMALFVFYIFKKG